MEGGEGGCKIKKETLVRPKRKQDDNNEMALRYGR